jgi:hypothetical protein
MPWWKAERELTPAPGQTYVDVLGRSAGLERNSLYDELFIS